MPDPQTPAPYEGTGVFYLGRPFDIDAGTAGDAPLLYDSADLTTHGFIVGMTGSGKTGLGIGLMEEAALDGIPVLAIDPKGDLGNMLLTFPELRPDQFQPWVNEREAQEQGITTDALAAEVAERWRSGLADWGQGTDRIQRLRDSAEFAVYTPGSREGRPLSVLGGLDAPAAGEGPDATRERAGALVSGLLSLVGVDADPLQSPEHVFLATVIEHAWAAGAGVDVASLIGSLQSPPMEKLGVLEVDTFFPPKARTALAMRLNALIASPSFAAWTEGEPLDVDALLHGAGGKPRVSVFSIAHLGDAERMFFVTRLLGEVVGWMRRQSGTGSLRAILYLDEIFGYLPPTANPPTKPLLLTLLKQARAFGVGVVLATQNPVDLDYKALSNCGTWWIGRLQTERDKARLLDGLEGASGGGFDRGQTDSLLSRLGKRVFYLHNVHESRPAVFTTRWTMSYLAGPLTLRQLGPLASAGVPPAPAAPTAAPAAAAPAVPAPDAATAGPPALPADVPAVTLAGADGVDPAQVVYVPMLLAEASVAYRSAAHDVDHTTRTVRLAEALDAPDWTPGEDLPTPPRRAGAPATGAAFQPVPAGLQRASAWRAAETEFRRWIAAERPLSLWRTSDPKLVSTPGEAQDAFQARVAHAVREARDAKKTQIRARYQDKLKRVEEQIQKADRAVDREQAQVRNRGFDAVVNVGSGLLGAFLGRRITRTSVRQVGQAARSAGRVQAERADVAAAEARRADQEAKYADLDADLTRELEALDLHAAPAPEPVEVRAKQTDVGVETITLAWVPFVRTADGRLARKLAGG